MFRDRLKALRAEHGLTQEALAKRIDVERSSIGKYESRQGVLPSTEVLTRLANLFHVTTDYLLDRENEEHGEQYDLEDNVILLCYHGKRIIRRIPKEKMPFLQEIIDKIAEE